MSRSTASNGADRHAGNHDHREVRQEDDAPQMPSEADSLEPHLPGLNPFLSFAQVAAMFGRSPRTVRWWVASGRLPHIKIGGAKFIPRAAIDRLIGGFGEGCAGGRGETGAEGSIAGSSEVPVCFSGDSSGR
jgi:excisionase family DNA binding protein